jgi:anti-sigma B factor antagonist
MDLEITQRERDGIPILDLRGNLIIGDTERLLRSTVAAMREKGRVNVILNFAKLNEIDDDGLATLVFCYAVLRKAGGALKLLNPSHVHMELFLSLKLDSLFETFHDEQDAVSSFFPDRSAERPYDILEFVDEQEKLSPSSNK